MSFCMRWLKPIGEARWSALNFFWGDHCINPPHKCGGKRGACWSRLNGDPIFLSRSVYCFKIDNEASADCGDYSSWCVKKVLQSGTPSRCISKGKEIPRDPSLLSERTFGKCYRGSLKYSWSAIWDFQVIRLSPYRWSFPKKTKQKQKESVCLFFF